MKPKTRDQLLAEWDRPDSALRASAASFVAPPPAAPVPAPAKADGPSPVEADASVTQAIAGLKTAAAAVLKAQQADPDGATDPKDAKVLSGIESIVALVDNLEKDQAADSDAAPTDDSGDAPVDDTKPPVTPPPPAADAPPAKTDAASTGANTVPFAAGDTPGNAKGIPGDGDDSPPAPGDIENDVVCENPECGHMASAHEDIDDGKNSGACNMQNCDCPGMVPPADALATGDDEEDDEDGDGGGPDNNGGDDTAPATSGAPAVPAAPQAAHAASTATFADGDAPAPPSGDAAPAAPAAAPATPPASGASLPASDPDPNASLMGPEFTIPVGIIEGMETGDGRFINEGALDWLECPRPLMGLKTSPHDPSGFDPNLPAVWIGRIDSIERAPEDNGVIQARGFLLPTDDAMEFAQIIEGMGKAGVSADVGDAEVDSVLDGLMPEMPPGIEIVMEDMEMPQVLDTLTKGTILGFTVVPFSAFNDCFIVLGDGTDQPPVTQLVDRSAATPEAPAEGSAPAAPVMASGALWRIVDDVCEPCNSGTAVLASGGPVAPPKSWFENPGFVRGDERLRETVDDKTGRLTGKFACPPTVTEDGRVFMHLAQWNVCHTSDQYKGKCMLAPRNHSGYAYWHGGGQVLTAEGELVDVGPVTLGTGHANPRYGFAETLSHYDNTGTAVAYGTVGEDEFGIWFAGVLAPDATPEQVFKLRASVPSGDWRPRGNRHELLACLMVNRGGFPQARAYSVNGQMKSLVAAGSPAFVVDEELAEPTLEERMARLEGSFSPLMPLAKLALNDRMAALRNS